MADRFFMRSAHRYKISGPGYSVLRIYYPPPPPPPAHPGIEYTVPWIKHTGIKYIVCDTSGHFNSAKKLSLGLNKMMISLFMVSGVRSV